MTSEERVKFALQHQEPDRIPLDFGATLLTGIHISAYKNLLTYLDIEKSEFPLMFERPQDVMIHDDVLDDADCRRRGHTINALHGNEAAVLLGDMFISHAFHLCSLPEGQRASRLIAATSRR